MLSLSDANRFRRLAAGTCLIAAPATLLIGALVHPQIDRDGAEHLAVVADGPDRYYAAHAVLLLGLALFLPTILALVHLLSSRLPSVAHLGGGLATLGVLGSTAIVSIDGIVVSQMGRPGRDPAEMAALLDRVKESSGLRVVAVVAAVSFLLGMMLLAYGLRRSRVERSWLAGGVAIAAALVFVGQVTDDRRIFALAFAAYLAVLGPLGLKVLSGSDEEWARAPEGAVRVRP